MHNSTVPPAREGPRINERIHAREVRLIDDKGENLGVVSLEEARRRSDEAGLDLVEISPNVRPPVCKILDYGRFKYEEQKRHAGSRTKQKVADLNEVKVRPNIEKHDYEVKLRTILRILDRGDKVRLVVRFRGREITRPERGFEVLKRMLAELEGKARVEQPPNMEGRMIVMVLGQDSGGKGKQSISDIIPEHKTRPRAFAGAPGAGPYAGAPGRGGPGRGGRDAGRGAPGAAAAGAGDAAAADAPPPPPPPPAPASDSASGGIETAKTPESGAGGSEL